MMFGMASCASLEAMLAEKMSMKLTSSTVMTATFESATRTSRWRSLSSRF
jgi:hypothetical protein